MFTQQFFIALLIIVFFVMWCILVFFKKIKSPLKFSYLIKVSFIFIIFGIIFRTNQFLGNAFIIIGVALIFSDILRKIKKLK